jgi:ribosomal protein S18 acetylase RimI-like enzyme
MHLAEPFRRRGFGTAMIAHAEREAKAMSYSTIVAWTSELQHAAIGFYASQGYTLAGEQAELVISAKTVGSGFLRYRFQKQLSKDNLPKPSLDLA